MPGHSLVPMKTESYTKESGAYICGSVGFVVLLRWLGFDLAEIFSQTLADQCDSPLERNSLFTAAIELALIEKFDSVIFL